VEALATHGSFSDSEDLPNEGYEKEFKLIEINEWPGDTKLELKFSMGEGKQERGGWLHAKDEDSAIGQSKLPRYKQEIEDKLMGSTWAEILEHDFTFGEASRMSETSN